MTDLAAHVRTVDGIRRDIFAADRFEYRVLRENETIRAYVALLAVYIERMARFCCLSQSKRWERAFATTCANALPGHWFRILAVLGKYFGHGSVVHVFQDEDRLNHLVALKNENYAVIIVDIHNMRHLPGHALVVHDVNLQIIHEPQGFMNSKLIAEFSKSLTAREKLAFFGSAAHFQKRA